MPAKLALRLLALVVALGCFTRTLLAADTPAPAASPAAAAPEAQAAQPAAQPAQQSAQSKYPPFADVVKEAKQVSGLITVYQKGTKLLAEITPAQLDRDFIVLIS